MNSEELLFSKYKHFPKHELRMMGLIEVAINIVLIEDRKLLEELAKK